jgi:hypothetical protein
MAPLPKPKADSPPPLERLPLAIRIGAAVWPELIASGWGSLGFSADVGVRYRFLSANIEAHGDPSLGSQAVANGSVSFARMSGALLACAHFVWFTGCAIGDAGRIFFPTRPPALPPSTSYAAAGVRAGLDFPVAPPRFFLRAGMDLRAPIHPVTYAPPRSSPFQVAGLGLGLGLGVLVELPP